MSLNTFSKITYAPEKEGDFDVSLVSDPTLKAAYESQGYNYGQTPMQLFKTNEAHPPKKPQIEALKSSQVSNDFPVMTVLVSPDRRFLHVGCGDGGLIVIQAK